MANINKSVAVTSGVALFAALAGLYGLAQTRVADKTIQASRGRSITSQLSGKERRVTVASLRPPPLAVAPPHGEDPIGWMTKISDAVLLVTVAAREGQFTATEDWIQSAVSADVVLVLKHSRRSAVRAGNKVSFREEGGVIDHEGIEITAVVPWAEPLRVGSTYLVFAAIDQDGALLIGPNGTYLQTATGFVSTSRGAPDALKRLGPSHESVLATIRSLAK